MVPVHATIVSTVLSVVWVAITFSGSSQLYAHNIADNGYQPWSPRHPIGSRVLSVRPFPPFSQASSGALNVNAALTCCTGPISPSRIVFSIAFVRVEWYHIVPSIHCNPCALHSPTSCAISSTVPPIGFSEYTCFRAAMALERYSFLSPDGRGTYSASMSGCDSMSACDIPSPQSFFTQKSWARSGSREATPSTLKIDCLRPGSTLSTMSDVERIPMAMATGRSSCDDNDMLSDTSYHRLYAIGTKSYSYFRV
mmetsp:Transcript_32916/g.36677  ORF Transcript_32916/g.36677 Transcript_32916/m.36677 type:complete len:253 (+) Transcript_32916:383-1141(+)